MENVIEITTGGTGWKIIATDATSYDTLALLLAAGKVAWPALDPGEKLQHLVLVARATGAVTLGSGFYFRTNLATAPTYGALVLAGVTYSYPGMTPVERIIVDNLWIKQSAASDIINITGIL